jgi:hypothetical protein
MTRPALSSIVLCTVTRTIRNLENDLLKITQRKNTEMMWPRQQLGHDSFCSKYFWRTFYQNGLEDFSSHS